MSGCCLSCVIMVVWSVGFVSWQRVSVACFPPNNINKNVMSTSNGLSCLKHDLRFHRTKAGVAMTRGFSLSNYPRWASLIVSVTILLTILLMPYRGDALRCEAELGFQHVQPSGGGDLSGPRRVRDALATRRLSSSPRDGKPSGDRAAGKPIGSAEGGKGASPWPRCRALSHIVFVAKAAGRGTATMRGELLVAALNAQPAHIHGAVTAHFTEAWSLGWHILRHGRPTVCVLIKDDLPGAADRCRAAGALIIWDLIDNPQSTNLEYLRGHDFDAIAVLTDVHATLLAKQGIRAVVLPHSHGVPRRGATSTSPPAPPTHAPTPNHRHAHT